MKKHIYTFLITVCLSAYGNAQTYTSAGNGNWTNPMTWTPLGVPLPGANVTINHDVILDTDFLYTSGSITIGNSGSLTENVVDRNFAIDGGTFTNGGVFTISNFAILSGSATNSGTISPTRFQNQRRFDKYWNC